MRPIRCLAALTHVLPVLLAAQSNTAGTWHFNVGASLGLHATHYTTTTAIPGTANSRTRSDESGAATTTFPFEVHYGVLEWLSVGMYLEPGSYIDSADTHPNRILSVGISPRFYIVNTDRFNWSALLDLGTTGLSISPAGEDYTDRYSGGHFRLGSGVSFYFGGHFGLQLVAKYAAYSLPWRERDPNLALPGFEAKLTTSGVHIGAGVTYRLGS